MIQRKLKICAGWDGNSHPAFLWKRIGGKGYCRDCTFRIEGQKTINKISDKQKDKILNKKEATKSLHNWFEMLWKKLPLDKFCTICNKPILGENLSVYWDHLLEKHKYPELALNEENICFCCMECHALKTGGNPRPKHKELIEQAKSKFLENGKISIEEYKGG